MTENSDSLDLQSTESQPSPVEDMVLFSEHTNDDSSSFKFKIDYSSGPTFDRSKEDLVAQKSITMKTATQPNGVCIPLQTNPFDTLIEDEATASNLE